MRISELSERTGVPAPAIKFYVREGLLPAGERTGPNQSSYDEGHVRRLRLIRALVEVGRLPVAAAKQVLDAVDSPRLRLHAKLGATQRALSPAPPAEPDPRLRFARAFARERGWKVAPAAPALAALAAALSMADSTGHGDIADLLPRFADAADQLAEVELDWVAQGTEVESTAERAVVGAVVSDAVLTALRRLAQTHASAARFGP